MLKQYGILSKCLSELKKSDLPLIEKLKLEVQLIQTKRVLLDYKVEQKVTGLARSEQEFDDFYGQLHSVCRSGGSAGEIERLKAQIAKLKDELGLASNGRNFPPPKPADILKAQTVIR